MLYIDKKLIVLFIIGLKSGLFVLCFSEAPSADFWKRSALKNLEKKLQQRNIEKQAQNVIFFLGDGMSVATVTGTRVYKNQEVHHFDRYEGGELHFEGFPHVGISKTFCSDAITADSACSATAYLGGSKGNLYTIGVSPTVKEDDCSGQQDKANQVESILSWAQKAGMATGIVTNTRITHATPAGSYAHIANRDWEYDGAIKNMTDITMDSNQCDDIAKQLITKQPGKNFNVILGGGRSFFLPESVIDEEGDFGNRTDGRNLIKEWQNMHPKNSRYIVTASELAKLKNGDHGLTHLLGLFSKSHLEYVEKLKEKNDPTLQLMTEVAIKMLTKISKSTTPPRGFFLFVEGGLIDKAHHRSYAHRAFRETLEFDDAIKTADDLTSDDDSLIVVTADHSHTMTIAGYPYRNMSILGPAEPSRTSADVDTPYPILSYANGPGYKNPSDQANTIRRMHSHSEEMKWFNYTQLATFKLKVETHGADDVMIYSKGPFAHLLTGVQQQSYIPWAIAYAACLRPTESNNDVTNFCSSTSNDDGRAPENFSSDANRNAKSFSITLTFVIALLKWLS